MRLDFPSVRIRIEAKPFYDGVEGFQLNAQYYYRYRIKIFNNEDYPIRLLRRKWFIYDGFSKRIVEGAGVVGQQPVLQPGEDYEYSSFCPIFNENGGMKGYFTFEKLPERTRFKVEIPPMYLMPNFMMN
jgi:ApaG protein